MIRQILIENGSHAMHNMGDVAMLQVAVRRLRTRFPEARLEVLTSAPERLQACCPGVTAVEAEDRTTWHRYQTLSRRLRNRVPLLDDWARARLPAVYGHARRMKARQRGEAIALGRFEESLARADLLVVSGGGFINDHFEPFARPLLEMVRAAKEKEKPVALFGQGIGPLQHPSLREEARRVLPLVDLIALREARASKPLLLELGVSPGRLVVTGDDAVESAFRTRPEVRGESIGVNIRLAWYADTRSDLVEPLGRALRRAARSVGAALVPVPISLHQGGEAQSDLYVARRLIGGSLQQGEDGAGLGEKGTFLPLADPEDILAQVGRCRLVVTGSYHAAVFALSQGKPAVCLAHSRYYWDKFLGLADQFGTGCVVLDLADVNLEEEVFEQVRRMWEEAEVARPSLLAAAEQQMGAGRAAYERLQALAFRSLSAPAFAE